MIVLLRSLAFVLALASARAQAALPELSEHELQARLAMFQAPIYGEAKKVELLKEKALYRIEKVTFSSEEAFSGKLIDYRFDLYLSKPPLLAKPPKPKHQKDALRPLVMIIPNINGATPLEGSIATYLASHGIDALVVHKDNLVGRFGRESSAGDRTAVNSVVLFRGILNYMIARRGTDPRRVGAFGISEGGIRSSLFYGVEDRLRALYEVVGGGNYPLILSESKEHQMVDFRADRFPAEGFRNASEFRAHLERTLKIDPIYFARRRGPQNVYMVISKRDTFVPTEAQWQLWEAFGRPGHRASVFSHVPTALLMVLHRGHVLKFFEKKLAVAR